jgi:amyloid beta precursor protein binding protein 1
MKADTESFVLLQKLYRDKAAKDMESYSKILHSITKPKGRSISAEVAARFCKGAASVSLQRSRSEEGSSGLSPEYGTISCLILVSSLSDPESDAVFYILLRAADRFFTLNNRFPGTSSDSFESDSVAFRALFSALVKEFGIELDNADDKVSEILRAGGVQLPNIAAIIGGIASQEIIKLITNQYVPLNNAIIYNGFKSTSSVFKL